MGPRQCFLQSRRGLVTRSGVPGGPGFSSIGPVTPLLSHGAAHPPWAGSACPGQGTQAQLWKEGGHLQGLVTPSPSGQLSLWAPFGEVVPGGAGGGQLRLRGCTPGPGPVHAGPTVWLLVPAFLSPGQSVTIPRSPREGHSASARPCSACKEGRAVCWRGCSLASSRRPLRPNGQTGDRIRNQTQEA